jgi:hypothetical protein
MSKNLFKLDFLELSFVERSMKSPLPLLSALYHHSKTLLASPIDQRVYKSLLGLNNIDIFDRWIQTHQLVPIAKPDLVYLQVRDEKEKFK